MIYRAPEYTKEFHCIASDCRDSCCIGWEISVDEETMQKYKTERGTLFSDIRASLSADGCFLLGENKRCPHLLKNGLCRIICEAGEEALCDICREHPRFYNYYGGVCEWGIGLSCESAAQRILSAENASVFYEKETDEAEEEGENDALFSLLFSERGKMLTLALNPDIQTEEKLLQLKNWGDALQNFIDNADICKEKFAFLQDFDKKERFITKERFMRYKEILEGLEPLDEGWQARCASLLCPVKMAEGAPFFSRLLAYFIYRYFLTYAMEGDCMAGIGFALFSVFMIYALCDTEQRKTHLQIAEAAKDFSKELEYSEENRDAVLDAFSAFSC